MIMRNCLRCGKAYNSTNPTACPECIAKDQKDFDKVRNFIKDNPRVSIDVVEEATGVSTDRIRNWIKLGKLEAMELGGPVLECERCGKPIYTGEYCVVCQSELKTTFRNPFANSGGSKNNSKEKEDKKRMMSFTKKYRNER